jgi:hypothetical protein
MLFTILAMTSAGSVTGFVWRHSRQRVIIVVKQATVRSSVIYTEHVKKDHKGKRVLP